MPHNWKSYKLGEITELIMGQSPKGETTNVDGIGYPLLNGPTEFGYSNPIPTQFTTDAKKLSEVNDLLFCVRGSTTGRMNFSDQVYAIGRGIGAFRGKNGYSTKYVKYLIDNYLDRLLNITTGSTFPNLSRTDILGFEVQSCDSTESDAIASILSSLDDKIELNLQMNKTLEEMAMTLYKHWFVDFGPFKDGNFVESELGMIPEGWEVKRLGELVKVTNGRAYKNDEFLEFGTPIIRIQNLNGGGKTVYSDIELPDEKYVETGDLIYAWSATFGPYIWHGPKSIYHYHIWRMDVDENNCYKWYMFHHLSRVSSQMKEHGTGSIFTHLTKSAIESHKLILPPKNILDDLNDRFIQLENQLLLNKDENQTLTSLRDTLLPKLISGEVRVKDVEQNVAEVL